MFKKLYERWAAEHARNNRLVKEVTMANVHRLFLIGVIGAVVALAHLLNFALMQPDNDVEALWRQGILISHALIFVCMSGLIVFGVWVRRHKPTYHPVFKVLQTLLLVIILSFGVAIAIIDQQVTTNITPFIMASLIGGLIFYSRPSKALLIYSLAWWVFVFSLAAVIDEPEILLTNRVNAFTAAALGFFLSFVIWQSKTRSIEQNETIAAQQKILIETNARLEYLAKHDQLTGLLNRTAFVETVEAHLEQSTTPGCLIMVDIDHFKAFNDRHGHPKGDQLLTVFANRLKEQVGSQGQVCRWGGEEFVIDMQAMPLKECVEVAESLRQVTTKVHLDMDEGAQEIAASFGVTALTEAETESFQSAYERVDAALYRAKSEGRNRVATINQKLDSTLKK